MDSLPEEVVELVAVYLSGTDLARCCAVSQHWREVFGRDRLWKPRCNQKVAALLETTENVTKPHFVSPENDGSTLSPIGSWRLSYMRENHLLNNWKTGNFVKKRNKYYIEGASVKRRISYKENYILEFKDHKIDVWDVKRHPQLSLVLPFQLIDTDLFMPFISAFEVKNSDKIVFVQGAVVRVFSLSLLEKDIQLTHIFSTEAQETFPDNSEEAVQAFVKRGGTHVTTRCSVCDNIFISMVPPEEALKLHIWNVDSGKKLKEEMFPTFNVKFILPSETFALCEETRNLLIDVGVSSDNCIVGHYYIYNLHQLIFLPFHVKHIISDKQSFLTVLGNCRIFKNYCAISARDNLYVYKYSTSELLYQCALTDNVIWNSQDNIVFHSCGSLQVFNLWSKSVVAKHDLLLTRCCVVVDGRAVISDSPTRYIIFEPDRHHKGTTGCLPLYCVPSLENPVFNNQLIFNDCGTKVIYWTAGHINVVHFW